MPKFFLVVAAASGLLAVVTGAFGAHALKTQLDQQALGVWQTAVHYQFFHSLALLAVALLLRQGLYTPALVFSGWMLIAGLLLFSGSLYGLAVGGPRWLGPVTPLGGLCFVAAWGALLVYAFRS